LKQRLPLLAEAAIAAQTVDRSRTEPRARIAVQRPLICVTGGNDVARAARFAGGLTHALRVRGAQVAALLASGLPHVDRDLARELEAAGAQPVSFLAEVDLPHTAIRALDELPTAAIGIAIGPLLAESLQGLLTVYVGPGRGHVGPQLDTVDLQLGMELDGVATRLAHWLAGQAKEL
jgi:hypothetical protein